MPLNRGKVWLITGCSSGLGLALARAALAHGERVVITARKPASLERLAASYKETSLALPLDVNDNAQITSALARAKERFGPIDVVVNNAGFLKLGAVEETSDEEYREMFGTNFFGPFQLIRAVLPEMRRRRNGQIVNISSIGSFDPRPGASAYSAAKAALDAASEALATEVQPFGIKVLIVVLGAFRTQVMESLTYSANVIEDYKATAHATRDRFIGNSGRQSGDPHKAALAIIEAVYNVQTPLRIPLGPGSVDRVRRKLASVTQEINAGSQVASSLTCDEA